jgi:nitrogen fixation/metabolism regulation signal transduction histidine kinase
MVDSIKGKKKIFSLKTKFLAMVVAAGLISYLAAVFVSEQFMVRAFENRYQEKVLLISKDILHHLRDEMVAENRHQIPAILNSHFYEGVAEWRIFNFQGQEVWPQVRNSPEPEVVAALRAGNTDNFQKRIDKTDIALYTVPIKNQEECRRCHGTGKEPLGALVLSLSVKEMNQSLSRERRKSFILFALIAVVVGTCTLAGVSRLFLKPMGRIREGTEAIGKGRLEYRIPGAAGDELGALAHNFNVMAQTLQGSFAELEDKNRQLAEQFLLVSRSQKEWQETFDSITDPMWVMKDDLSIVRANRAFKETFTEILSHRECWDLFEDWSLAHGPGEIKDKTSTTSEIHLPGMGKIFQISVFPFTFPGGDWMGSICIAKDITEKKENEMQLIMSERLSSLGQMASRIGHEINTPLATIRACAEGLSRRLKTGKFDSAFFERYLGIIEEEIQECTKIIRGMLSFVRKMPDEKKKLKVNELLDRALEMFGPLGRLKNVTVVRNYKEGIPEIYGIEGELRQALLSIIGNGLDAMEEEGTLTLDTGVNGNSVFIRISDTGPGIPQGLQRRIFDSFFTTKAEKGGTGLGLSIADRIIKGYKGRIDVTSEEGQGASFQISLPL